MKKAMEKTKKGEELSMWEKSMKAQGFIKVVDFGPTFVWVKHSPQVSDTRGLRETRQLHRQALRMLPHDGTDRLRRSPVSPGSVSPESVFAGVRFRRGQFRRGPVSPGYFV